MRFFEDGPNIPDHLLEMRDQGRVVFLCGAGVSKNYGMPDFYELTKYVIDFFAPPRDSAIESDFRPWIEDFQSGKNRTKISLDQIFHMLHLEYGRQEVNNLVAERLHLSEKANIESPEHRVISKISSDLEGNPQIITTNFDHLFEPTLGSVHNKLYQPPTLPDISLGVPLTGVTYLHGRLQEPGAKQHPYILSSADFGRAYLSEGWATNFIRSLLEKYTVVLIGYQAEDSPVKYLLQGLNHDGLSDRSNLYAFDKGLPEDIETKWRDRGVTAIACKEYTHLWQTLTLWADRASDPRHWKIDLLNKATKGPRLLKAYERGQVAHLVRTTPGARLFANTKPSPPAEWLCVFDARCRSAEESRSYGDDIEVFDPLNEYCLDDDPARPMDADENKNVVYDHLLDWRREDANPPNFHNLAGRHRTGHEKIPPRLAHLSNWIIDNINSPITAWWAARQSGLHPRLQERIMHEIQSNNELHEVARLVWGLILEYQMDDRNFSFNIGWYGVKKQYETEGWSRSVLRAFETATAPILSQNKPLSIYTSKPPLDDWADSSIQKIANWTVSMPHSHIETTKIDDDDLEAILRIYQNHFIRAAGFHESLNMGYADTTTCYPEREVVGKHDDEGKVFLWFVELFSRLCMHKPEVAKGYALSWSFDDRYYFRKLKLFALNKAELFNAKEAAEKILSLSQEFFWDTGVRRELLFLLCDRWEQFTKTHRKALVKRLLAGPNKPEDYTNKEFADMKNRTACLYTSWLRLQGCSIAPPQATKLDNMILYLANWDDSWISSFAEKRYSSIYTISLDETPTSILNLPLNQVIEYSEAESRREFGSRIEKRPFTGLVKVNPRKALSTLSVSTREGRYPHEFWRVLISEWPETSPPRLYRTFLHRVKNLPHETIRDLRYTIGRWLQNHLIKAFKFDEVLAWNTFDCLVSGLISDNGVALASSIKKTRPTQSIHYREQSTLNYDYAVNSPLGCAMEGLLSLLDWHKLGKGAEIPEQIKSRIEHLLSTPKEGKYYAAVIISRQLEWLYFIDPNWIIEHVMPWFLFNHEFSESAWSGYLSSAKILPPDLGVELKPLLLDLFPRIYKWSDDGHRTTIATQIIIEKSVIRNNEPDGLDIRETRQCLRNMSEKNRRDAIYRLAVIGKREKHGWSKYVIPFINEAWPRERGLRTTGLVTAWISLLKDSDTDFPSALNAVQRFLVPIERESHWLDEFCREFRDRKPLTEKYPDSVLELLDAVIPNSTENIPYQLSEILNLIDETDPCLISDPRYVRLIRLLEQT